MKISALLSVYFKENPQYLRSAIDSLFSQTFQASEIILVKDGQLTEELENVIKDFSLRSTIPFILVPLEKNVGLGNALKIGVQHCTYDIIARMDTDDIARPDRFKAQFDFLAANPDIDVVGGNMEEFNKVPGDLGRFKINPENHTDLVKGIYFRNPFNHPTVMYRKSSVLRAGNYNGEQPLFEDYALFLRMWKAGMKFHNLQDIMIDFRVGSGIETIKRRSGVHYLRKELSFLDFARNLGVFSQFDILKYKILKFPIRLMPPKVVLFIYNAFLRKKQ